MLHRLGRKTHTEGRTLRQRMKRETRVHGIKRFQDKMVADKMVADKMVLDKMVWTK